MKNKILICTPIAHIKGLSSILAKDHTLLMHENSDISQLTSSKDVIAVFTNPNQLRFRLNAEFFNLYPNLKNALATLKTVEPEEFGPTLVVCPSSAMMQWSARNENETKSWYGKRSKK